MNIEQLKNNDYICFENIRGSHLYGLNRPESDIDIGGLYCIPIDQRLKLITSSSYYESSDEKHDICYYDIKKYLTLASSANPTILEMMWIPDNFIKINSNIYQELIKYRDIFLTKKCFHSFTGYAYAQIKKSKGQNKKVHSYDKYVDEEGIYILKKYLNNGYISKEWIEDRFNKHIYLYLIKTVNNNCILKDIDWKCMDKILDDDHIKYLLSPRREDFCYIVEDKDKDKKENMPFRPKQINNLNIYDISSVEHMSNSYRLYKDGKGIFRNNQLILTSIEKEREWKDFIGILYYNENEYEKQKREYISFWEWMANKNEERWKSQESGDMDYDCKNMMHTVRLLFEAHYIATDKKPHVYFSDGDERDFLMNIRYGKYDHDYILSWADDYNEQLRELYNKSDLPYQVDMNIVEELYKNLIHMNKEILE